MNSFQKLKQPRLKQHIFVPETNILMLKCISKIIFLFNTLIYKNYCYIYKWSGIKMQQIYYVFVIIAQQLKNITFLIRAITFFVNKIQQNIFQYVSVCDKLNKTTFREQTYLIYYY